MKEEAIGIGKKSYQTQCKSQKLQRNNPSTSEVVFKKRSSKRSEITNQKLHQNTTVRIAAKRHPRRRQAEPNATQVPNGMQVSIAVKTTWNITPKWRTSCKTTRKQSNNQNAMYKTQPTANQNAELESESKTQRKIKFKLTFANIEVNNKKLNSKN